jgi:uncharacterized protein
VPSDSSKSWSWTYLAGLFSAGILFGSDATHAPATVETLLAGILVGFGTRMGTGCTSGHGLALFPLSVSSSNLLSGICGLPRLSLRSLVAVGTFMVGGAATAFFKRYIEAHNTFPLLVQEIPLSLFQVNPAVDLLLPTVVSYVAFYALLKLKDMALGKPTSAAPHSTLMHTIIDHLSSYLAALTFGYGLVKSGMCSSDRVVNFLDFSSPNGWDPSLMAVMGSGVILNLISFNVLHIGDHQAATCPYPSGHEKASTMKKSLKIGSTPENTLITDKLIIGSLIFGMGWGLGGVCPGPAIVNLGASSPASATFMPAILLGITLHEYFKDFLSKKPVQNGKKKA